MESATQQSAQQLSNQSDPDSRGTRAAAASGVGLLAFTPQSIKKSRHVLKEGLNIYTPYHILSLSQYCL